MVAIMLFKLIQIVGLFVAIWFILNYLKRKLTNQEYCDSIKEAKEKIKATEEISKDLPKINKEQLRKNKKKIDDLLNEAKDL